MENSQFSISHYPLMKDSGVEWIGEIPEGWEVKKLKYVTDLRCGSNLTSEQIKPDGKYPVYGGNGLRGYYGEFTHEGHFVLIGRQGALCGNINYAKGKFWATEHAVVAMPIKKYKTIWLGELLRTMNLNQYSVAAAQPGLAVDAIKNLLFPYPHLQEQTAIANYLDCKTAEIDQLIAQKERLLCLYEEEKNAIINQAVTQGINPDVGAQNIVPLRDSGIDWLGEIPEHWEVKRSRYLFEIRKRIAGKLGFDILSITQKGIKVKDITNNDGQMASDYSKYQMVEKGDFAMNHMDLLTGFIDIADQEGVTSPDYRVFSSIDNESDSKFYLFLFQMMYTRKIFYAFGRGAALFGRWRLPADEFKSFLLSQAQS